MLLLASQSTTGNASAPAAHTTAASAALLKHVLHDQNFTLRRARISVV
jgi:hypothetical protein